MATTQRKKYIDALRAIAMIIVMVWHFSNGVESQWIFNILTSAIMIPLFFIISGYVFNDCKGDNKIFFSKLIKYLVLPWLGLALLKGGVIAICRKSIEYYYEFIINLFTGDNLWYFPCLILAEIIFYFTHKAFKDNAKHMVISGLVCFIGGLFLSRYKIFDYVNFSTAFICQLFLLMGYLIKKYESISIRYGRYKYILLIGYCTLCAFLIFRMQTGYGIMDIHRNYYFSLPINLALIISGGLCIWALFYRLSKIPKFLVFIGENTIVFYVFHYDTIMPLTFILQKLGLHLPNTWLIVGVKLLWSLTVCSLLCFFFNRYFPILVGKRTQQQVPATITPERT